MNEQYLVALEQPTAPGAEVWRLAVHRHFDFHLLDAHIEGIVPQVAVAAYVGQQAPSMPSEERVGLKCAAEQRLVRHAVGALAQKLELHEELCAAAPWRRAEGEDLGILGLCRQ